MVVGGNSRYEVSFCLHTLAIKQQTVMGIGKGNKTQLEELVELLASGQVFSFSALKEKKYFKWTQMCSIQNKTNQIALQKPQLFVMPPA